LLLIWECTISIKECLALVLKNHWQSSNVGLLAICLWLGCIYKNAVLGAMSVNVKKKFKATTFLSGKSFF
jgi:hypothetical protein